MNTKIRYTIEDLECTDIPLLSDLPPEDWVFDIVSFMEGFYPKPWFYALKVVRDEVIAGTGSILFNNGTSWLSNIIVRPEYREHGMGSAVTSRLIEISHEMECPSCLLMATGAGRRLYSRLGFVEDGMFCYYRNDVPLPFSATGNIIPAGKNDQQTILQLDRQVTGEDRGEMLNGHLHRAHVYRKDGEISGFYLPGIGDEPVIATHPGAGQSLLAFKHSLPGKTTVIPEENRWAAKFFREHGIEPFSCRMRMVHGPSPDWSPEGVFCRIEGYYC